jgi:CheY-like chemotaxis protein
VLGIVEQRESRRIRTLSTSKEERESQKRILLVDDDVVQLENLAHYLNRSGFLTLTCEDGDEAIAALEGFPIDIMVCDVQMPRVNGLSVVNWVKEHRLDLKVILMTAFSSYELYQIATDKGAVMYLEKPIDPKLLVEIISNPITKLPGREQVVNACLEASNAGEDGEVVVRSNDAVGRIFFSKGKAAWATHSRGSGIFMNLLRERSGLDKSALSKAAILCRREGFNIIDIIVQKGVLDEESMKGILLESISSILGDMLDWNPCKALFLPVARPFEGNFSFPFEEVLKQADRKRSKQS